MSDDDRQRSFERRKKRYRGFKKGFERSKYAKGKK